MLAVIVTVNGVKKIVKVTADAGAGNPVGSLLHTYKKFNPSGYLYCDGSTFDQTKYPLLYAYLGTNVLPDYREAVEVGAEQNTTDSIATHDVYTEGQFKDDQLQEHNHGINFTAGSGGSYGINFSENRSENYDYTTITGARGRTGTTTHGKQKAVFVYIKATSGLSENAQDNVINTLNEERSYSTEEVNTGKKWIDGKPIYRKVIVSISQSGGNTEDVTALNIASLVNLSFIILADANNKTIIGNPIYYDGNALMGINYNNTTKQINIFTSSATDLVNKPINYILEYTKAN